jgi:2-iminobutanoate/2-iminopropanoate deaminase
MNKPFLVLSLLTLPFLATAQRKAINLQQPSAARPLSDAILVGDTLYLSGKLGHDAKGDVPATFEEEARNALEGQRAVLKAAGFDFADVVKVTVFVTDLKNFADWNKVYSEFFKVDPPARSTVQVAALVRGGHVEVEMIAVKSGKPHMAPVSGK